MIGTEVRYRIEPKKFYMHREYVYVASPYSNGDKLENVKQSIEVAEELIKLGYVPYLPLLSHFWDELIHHDYQFWMDYDKKWLSRCAALLRIGGISSGADKEVEYAKMSGIPIFYSIEELEER